MVSSKARVVGLFMPYKQEVADSSPALPTILLVLESGLYVYRAVNTLPTQFLIVLKIVPI